MADQFFHHLSQNGENGENFRNYVRLWTFRKNKQLKSIGRRTQLVEKVTSSELSRFLYFENSQLNPLLWILDLTKMSNNTLVEANFCPNQLFAFWL